MTVRPCPSSRTSISTTVWRWLPWRPGWRGAAGADKIRINPGNIGPREHVDRVVDAAKANGAVIRVGVNSGSVEKHLLQKYGGPCVEAMVESALSHVRMLEDRGFYDTKISLKSSSVLDTIAAYRLLARSCDYPLHIGVTEAGGLRRGPGHPAA